MSIYNVQICPTLTKIFILKLIQVCNKKHSSDGNKTVIRYSMFKEKHCSMIINQPDQNSHTYVITSQTGN